MKVILLQDVPKVGRKYEVKQVADGYARNFLFPHKWAERATKSTEKQLEKKIKNEKVAEKVREDELLGNLKEIEGKTITAYEKVNEKGHLFQGITAPEIAKRIKESLGVDIPSDYIQLEKPIKEAGAHTLTVSVAKNTTQFTFSVEKEGTVAKEDKRKKKA